MYGAEFSASIIIRRLNVKHKNTLQEQRRLYYAMFGDTESLCCEETGGTIDEYDDAINDCMAMLQYSLDQNDKSEISYWRKALQEVKVQRRMLTA